MTRESVADGRDHARDDSPGNGEACRGSRPIYLTNATRATVMTLSDTDHVGRFAQVTFQQHARTAAQAISEPGAARRAWDGMHVARGAGTRERTRLELNRRIARGQEVGMQCPASCARLSSHVYVVRSLALICALALAPGNAIAQASSPAQQPATAAAATPAPKIPNEQLDSLVAPIALYPDPLLSQTLVASTYPLEIVQLHQWLEKNKNLKDKALTDAALKQPWDPSIQAMVVLPDVVNRLANDIQWTTDLGNAFLAQQSDVMDAVQRMRVKAQGTGALSSNEQQKVETKVVENKTVVIIEPAQPDVVYVPSYSPVVVYGPPIYPYPPIYYPYYPPYSAGAVVATSMISFGVGVAVGAAWGGGGWGWGCGWGNNDIDINVNNNFVRNNNIRNNNISGNRVGNNTWRHDASHRGGAPYSNRATADRYGGTARGDSLASRGGAQQMSARQPVGTSGRTTPSGTRDLGSTRSGGGEQIGSRSVPRSSGGGSSAFSGSSSGGSRARATSSRGAMSAGGARGGGRRR